MKNSMVIFERAAVMLAEADTIQKARELKSLALSAADWARRKGMGEEAILHCRSYALEAERKLGQMLRETELQKGGRPRKTANRTSAVLPPPSLKELGLTDRESSEAQMLAKTSAEDFAKLKEGKKSKVQLRREIRESMRQLAREINARKISTATKPEELSGKFTTVVIDPPWDWGDEGDVDQMGRAKPDYHTLSLSQIFGLPVKDLSAPDAHLYLWITARSLPKGFGLLDAWGYRYVTALVWPKPSFGMGNYFRGQTEFVLFGVRGSLALKRKDVSTLLPSWKRGKGHSAKPLEFAALVESCSPGPYLEMFSRTVRTGWTQWGENSK